MRWSWIWVIIVFALFTTPVRALAGEILDLPPVDISQGDWWVALLIWWLTRNRKTTDGASR